ncbi:hypothetical protein E2562_031045 [Oryza meyeriana var. granulata]|uniref:C2H2-type domain-containing protein n=1 Tax=Oryza meyeriana var. granulata TaxID=110450 RepID=A0A6G1FE39_9ORYZ|nr:hypothetical protein E2562_031045 [Oryza meyeriana var. granulata]
MAGEEEDLANCLVMLSSSKVDHASVTEEQESAALVSKEYRTLISFTKLTSTLVTEMALAPPVSMPHYVLPVPCAMFECKAWKKVFSLHQDLGGQRANHKKVKGCFAAKLESSTEADDRNEDNPSEATAEQSMVIIPMELPVAALAAAPLKKKGKMHECSVCHRLFTSGQALGGHKCCHWLTSSSADHGGLVANIPPLAKWAATPLGRKERILPNSPARARK